MDTLTTSIIETVTNTGIWAALFVFLFFYLLKDSKTREEKYRTTIETLTSSLQVVVEIKKSVEELKTDLKEGVSSLKNTPSD